MKLRKYLIIIISMILFLVSSSLTIEASECFSGCTGTKVGYLPVVLSLDEEINTFNYQTNVGFCEEGTNPNGVIMKLCDCPDIAELSADKEYTLSITIDTQGVYFEAAKDATQVDIAISTYILLENACVGKDASSELTLVADVLEEDTVCLTNTPMNFLIAGASYIKVVIPTMYYVVDEISTQDSIKITLSIISADTVCTICTAPICSCTQEIAKFGCMQCKNTLQYVLVNNVDWWCGLVITNTTASSGTATVTLYKQDGTSVVSSISLPANQVYTTLAETLFSDVVTSEVGYLVIESTCNVETLCILGSNSGVYGYQGTNCCTNCE